MLIESRHIAVAGVLSDEKRIGCVDIEETHQRRQHNIAMVVGRFQPEVQQDWHHPSAHGKAWVRLEMWQRTTPGE